MPVGLLSLDDFLARRSTDRRLARLTHDIALPEGRGLEFGPGSNPTPLPEGLFVEYIDYALDASAGLVDAVLIDRAWSGSGQLSDVLGQDGFQFAIAAQVAQYVPNLLGWLRGIHGVLRPGGVLNLSFPDKRFMFDATRPVSTLAELVEADLLSFTRPSPRQLFSHSGEVRAVTPEEIWAGAEPSRSPRMAGYDALAHAYAQTVKAQTPGSAYVPCHCWVFTPASFLDCIADATGLGLFPFVLNQVSVPQPGEFEFFVSARRDAEDDPEELRHLQAGAISHLRGIVEAQRRIAALVAK